MTPRSRKRRKRRTRREWTDKHAAEVRVHDICQAYDKSPRNGGQRVAYIVITGKMKESISLMPDEDYEHVHPCHGRHGSSPGVGTSPCSGADPAARRAPNSP